MTQKKDNRTIYESVNPEFRLSRGDLRTVAEYTKGIRAGNRTILSQAITLVESSKEAHSDMAQEIIRECLPLAGNSIRIGITGVPGVGKSTFIESLGKILLEKGQKIAVLTVDPSSIRSKGSILGDKTRMPVLSAHKQAYIRPSPASGSLGGVARKTRETIILCEAAGFETIFIETVGVGQSETAVHSMVDFFLLLMLAGAGDELQGIKRGIMEMADLIAINKADGDNVKQAGRAKAEYENGLSLFPVTPSRWKPTVHTCSALEGHGLESILGDIERYFDAVKLSGYFDHNRREQSVFWMRQTVENRLNDQFYSNPKVKDQIKQKEKDVRDGIVSPFKAALDLLALNKT